MRRISLGRRALLGSAVLATGFASIAVHAEDETAVTRPIQQLNDELLAIMKAGPTATFEQRVAMLGPVVDQTFDLPAILRESIGATWQSLSAAQQQELLTSFRRYTIASYVNSFDHYDGQRFVVQPTTSPVGANGRIVRTRIVPRTGEGHQLDYVMRQVDGTWKVADVLADGTISRVAVQRSDFRRLLARGGAPALVAELQQKTADLSRG
jgi:phospholipid transport system substrate-binding protein